MLDYLVGTSDGAAIGGLTSGESYYAITVDATHIKLATADAASPAAIITEIHVVNGQTYYVLNLELAGTFGFDPTNKVDLAADTILLPADGLVTGQKVTYSKGVNATVIDGLTDNTDYYVIRVQDKTDRVQLATSEFGALAGTAIDLKAGATGTEHSITKQIPTSTTLKFDPTGTIDDEPVVDTDVDAETIILSKAEDLVTGQKVTYSKGGIDNVKIGGLNDNTAYYVIRVKGKADRVQLATSEANALAGTAIDLTDGATGTGHSLTAQHIHVLSYDEAPLSFKPSEAVATDGSGNLTFGQKFDPLVTIDGKPVVDVDANTILLSAENLVTGQKVTYSKGDSANAKIGGLTDNAEYYVIRMTGKADRVQLATSKANALNGTAIDLTAGATGTGHSLNEHHGLQTGDAVVYRTDPGIRHEIGMTRFANFTLPNTVDNPAGNTVVTFNPGGKTVDGENVIDMTIDPDAGDDIINAIVLGGVHDYVTGQRVTYSSGTGGTDIGGLSNGDYFIIAIADDRIQLATTRANALAGTAISLNSIGTGSTHTLTTNPVDLTDNIIVSAGHGYETGQKITYLTDGGTAVGKLTPQNEYYVIRVSDNLLKLSSTRDFALAGTAVDLTAGATGTHSLMSDTVVMLFDGGRNAPVVDLTANTIELIGHGFIGGETVTYSNGDGNAIGGLTTGGKYTVVRVDDDHIKLATTNQAAPGATAGTTTVTVGNQSQTVYIFDLTAGATTGLSQHLLYTANDAKIIQFDPTPIAAVDVGNKAIQLTGEHRFKAGERVTYLTGGGTAIGGLFNGRDYFVIPTGDSSFQLADTTLAANLLNGGPKPLAELTVVALSGGATGDRQGFERASTAARGDTAIGGLQDGQIYFVTKVNNTTIRLSDSPLTATASLPIDLELPSGLNSAGTVTHTLQAQGEEAGINVIAGLESENRSISQTRIGGTPTLADFLTANVAQDPKTAKAIASGGAGFLNVNKAAKFSLSASVAVAAFDHDVLAQVGEHAILESGGNITVNASAEQSVQVSAEGTVTSEALRPGVASQKIGSASIAVAVGTYNTTVRALVLGGAKLDAIGDIAVTSDVSYPLLIDSLPFHKDRFAINDPAEGSVTDELASALNGKLGLNNMMNVWASTKGRVPQGKATITGSIGITSYTNVSEAIIGAGAKINQKDGYIDD